MPKNLLFVFFLIGSVSFDLSAYPVTNISCTGQACDSIPENLKSQLNEIPLQFQSQYLDKVMTSMLRATAAANTASGLTGLGSVNRWQLGISGTAASSDSGYITFKYRDIEAVDLPNAGFSIAPNVMGSINLGWLFGKGPRDQAESSRSFLNRFMLYGNGISMSIDTKKDMKKIIPSSFEYNGDIHMTQYGLGLRFQLLYPSDDRNFFFHFLGATVGVAYHRQNMTMDFDNDKKSNTRFRIGTFAGSWVSDTSFHYGSKMNSYPVDIRTGFQFLRFINFFGGVGFSKSSGDAEMVVHRNGVLRVSQDLIYSFNAAYLSPSMLASIKDQARLEGNLDIYQKTTSHIHFTQSFFVGGFEVNLWVFQLIGEVYAMEKTKSATIGLKLNF